MTPAGSCRPLGKRVTQTSCDCCYERRDSAGVEWVCWQGNQLVPGPAGPWVEQPIAGRCEGPLPKLQALHSTLSVCLKLGDPPPPLPKRLPTLQRGGGGASPELLEVELGGLRNGKKKDKVIMAVFPKLLPFPGGSPGWGRSSQVARGPS